MTPAERTELADKLAHAYETRIPIDPPSHTASLTIDDAYAVQSLQIEHTVRADFAEFGPVSVAFDAEQAA